MSAKALFLRNMGHYRNAWQKVRIDDDIIQWRTPRLWRRRGVGLAWIREIRLGKVWMVRMRSGERWEEAESVMSNHKP